MNLDNEITETDRGVETAGLILIITFTGFTWLTIGLTVGWMFWGR